MIDLLRAGGLSLLALIVFGALLVLPGVRLADRLAGDARTFAPRVLLAVAISQMIVAATGIVLIAFGLFSGWAVALVAVVCSVAGLPVALRWLRESRRELPLAGWAAVLALPWVVMVGLPGWPPSDTLQWYYAGLGAQLSGAGGVPVAVAEWGLAVRWLPDYLVFNVDSEAFLTALSFLPRADVLAAWRVPVTVLGVVVLFVVVRLWVAGRPPSWVPR